MKYERTKHLLTSDTGMVPWWYLEARAHACTHRHTSCRIWSGLEWSPPGGGGGGWIRTNRIICSLCLFWEGGFDLRSCVFLVECSCQFPRERERERHFNVGSDRVLTKHLLAHPHKPPALKHRVIVCVRFFLLLSVFCFCKRTQRTHSPRIFPKGIYETVSMDGGGKKNQFSPFCEGQGWNVDINLHLLSSLYILQMHTPPPPFFPPLNPPSKNTKTPFLLIQRRTSRTLSLINKIIISPSETLGLSLDHRKIKGRE